MRISLVLALMILAGVLTGCEHEEWEHHHGGYGYPGPGYEYGHGNYNPYNGEWDHR
jgi:hypothetical protein